jgi:hypothetical protein
MIIMDHNMNKINGIPATKTVNNLNKDKRFNKN